MLFRSRLPNHILSHLLNLVFFTTKLLILLLEHLLKRFHHLCSSLSHLFGFLLVHLVDLDACALDGLPDLLVVLQVLVSHLPFFEPADQGVLRTDLLHSLRQFSLQPLYH